MRTTRPLPAFGRELMKILSHSRLLACSLALAAAAPWAAAQDIELYDRPDFGGTRLTLDMAAPDLGRFGMGAQVSSVVVRRGQWEFCTQPQFRGACVTVGPGRYGRLPPALNDSLASLRPAGGAPVAQPQPAYPPQSPAGGPPAIVLYADNFTGPELRLFDGVNDLRSRAFNDTTSTVDVRSGQWELCSDGGLSGQCLRFGPGRHVLPPPLFQRLSSLRLMGPGGAPGQPMPPSGGPGPNHGHGPWPGAAPAIVFHENHDFSGRRLPLAGPAPDFSSLGFNDRASAVEIFRGRWQLCRHAGFQGECVVIGPGRHALGGSLQDAVSSARPLFGRNDQPMAASGAVTLHDDIDFRGRSVLVDGPVRNLRELDFNDRALSIEVHGGQWELCSSSDHRGRCLVFGPGWHRLPEGMARELSSLRPR